MLSWAQEVTCSLIFCWQWRVYYFPNNFFPSWSAFLNPRTPYLYLWKLYFKDCTNNLQLKHSTESSPGSDWFKPMSKSFSLLLWDCFSLHSGSRTFSDIALFFSCSLKNVDQSAVQSSLLLVCFSFKLRVTVLHVGQRVQAIQVSLLPWVCAGGSNPVKGTF